MQEARPRGQHRKYAQTTPSYLLTFHGGVIGVLRRMALERGTDFLVQGIGLGTQRTAISVCVLYELFDF